MLATALIRSARLLADWALVAALTLSAGMGVVRAQVPLPELKARVTDLTQTLSSDRIQALDQKLAQFEARKGAQIAVLLLPTTQPESIEQFSIRLAEKWKVGRKGVDDGAILIIAKDDRALRIEVGYGLEGALTDLVANRIIEDIMVPQLRRGDFYGAVDAGVDAMIRVVDGEALPAPQGRRAPAAERGPDLQTFLVIAFVLVFVLGSILRGIVGRGPAAALVGGATGVAAWFFIASLLAAGVAAIVAFFIALAAGAPGRPGGIGRGGGWPSGGGGFGGGGGGFSGGGGWSGGGGGFGGGGASGRW